MRLYFDIAVLLVVSLTALLGMRRLLSNRCVSAKHQLLLAQTLFVASFAVPVTIAFVPTDALVRPPIGIWLAVDNRTTTARAGSSGPSIQIVKPTSRRPSVIVTRRAAALAALTVLTIIVAGLCVLIVRLRKVTRLLSSLPIIRTVGRVRIAVSDEAPVPFSARTPRWAFVVLPTAFVGNRRDCHIAIRHELQHHRQRDPAWAIVIETCRMLFPWHPAMRAWASRLEQQQEFACDEALVGRRGVSAYDYSRCLLRAAEAAMHSSYAVAGTSTMGGRAQRSILARRIDVLLNQHVVTSGGTRSAVVIGAAACTIALMTSVAYASRSVIQDRTITRAQAEALVDKAMRSGTPIPLAANDRVVDRLNWFAGTPSGRTWMQASLQRMRQYEPVILAKLEAKGLPVELLAIPLIESGYRNDVSGSPGKAVGIWQLLPATARHYGSDPDRDDWPAQTDAAIRLLTDLHATFGDWMLALKAYNEGPTAVSRSIAAHNSRDAWELDAIRSNDNYLPTAIAAMIILRNPEILD